MFEISSASSSTPGSSSSAPAPCRPIPPAVPPKDGCCPCDCGDGAGVCPATGTPEVSVGGQSRPASVQRLACAAPPLAYSSRLRLHGAPADANFGGGVNWLAEPYYDECGGVATVVFGPCRTYTFDRVGSSYVPRFGAKQTLAAVGGGVVRFGDTDGGAYDFHDHEQAAHPRGTLKSYTAPGGDRLEAQSYANGRTQEYRRTHGSHVDSYLTSFVAGGENGGLVESVTLRRSGDGGATWAQIRRSVYTYYGSAESHGNARDLKTAAEQVLAGGSTWTTLGTHYFRYYRPGESNGFAHGLKLAVGPEAFKRLGAATGGAPFAAADAAVRQYADHYYEYDADRRATKSVSRGGLLTYTLAYADNAGETDDYNHWRRKTTITRPDGGVEVVYTNHIGQELLRELRDAAGTRRWVHHNVYGTEAGHNAALLLQQAMPSAVQTYVDNGGSNGKKLVVTLRASQGLIRVNDYYPTDNPGAGGAPGYLRYTGVKEGSAGPTIRLTETKYTSVTAGGVTIYPVAESTVYPEAGDTSVTQTTSYAYTWHASPDTLQMRTRVTTLPAVTTWENGSGAADVRRELFDAFGNLVAAQDERGYINTYAYDTAKGFMTQRVQDAPAPSGSGWTANPGTRLELTTDFTSDDPLGRVTQTLGPIHDAVVAGSSVAVRTADWTAYDDVNGRTFAGRGYATGTGFAWAALVGPVTISYTDEDGRPTQTIVAERTSGSGAPSPSDTYDQADWKAWTVSVHNDQGQLTETRTYFDIPASGGGTEGVNYRATRFGYDAMGRQSKVTSPGGTTTRTTFDPRGLPTGVAVGTDDSATSANNMVTVAESQYDNGAAGGDGHLTRVTRYASATDARVTTYAYDFRGRRTSEDGEVDAYAAYTYDNLDRVTQVDRKNTTSTGSLIGQRQTFFDGRGRVYRTKTFAVDPAAGTVGHALTGDNWYDPAGNLVASVAEGAGQHVYRKAAVDPIGRTAGTYFGYNAATRSYANATTVNSDDAIFEQTAVTHDAAGNVLSAASFQRLNDDATSTGSLTTGNARVSYAAGWTDGAGRSIASANYGAVSSFTRPATVPARSDTVLVTEQAYDDGGRAYRRTDPKGIITETAFDALGRATQAVEDVGGLARTTQTTYAPDGGVATLTAVNPATGNQTTTYTYGTTLADSGVARTDLPRHTDYPGSVGGSDRTSSTYNRLGQVATFADQRGTVRTFDYDKLGRLLHDRVTAVGTDTDSAVRRISRTYEVRGMLATVGSYASDTPGTGTPADEVKLTYNDFGQLVTEQQDHATSASGSSPAVSYTYAAGGSGSNQVRPTAILYPDARQIDFDYGTAGGTGDRLSRIGSIKDGSTSLAAYTYLGAGTVVRVDYPLPQVMLDLWGGTGGTFDGLDRFGRVTDQRWASYGATPADLDRYRYGYDRKSNRASKQNVVSAAASVPLDEFYQYDGLDRLRMMDRGTLNGTQTGLTGTPAEGQTWGLDATGNWELYLHHTAGTTDLDQSRAHNAVNQVTAITEMTGPAWADPAYDAAGNTILFPRPADPTQTFTAAYDAWNRLREVKAGAATVAKYRYDGRRRRIVEETYAGGALSETRHLYYSDAWQVLEERVGTAASADRQYVWGLRYVDELVCRDRALSGGGAERLYALQDANFNVTAIADTGGAVAQRFVYDPYGADSVRSPAAWAAAADAFAWPYRHQGGRMEDLIGLYHVRNRSYSPILGVWLQRDHVEYLSSVNLYEYLSGTPLTSVDPTGLWSSPDHTRLTVDSLEAAFAHSTAFRDCRPYVLDVLIEANLGQDEGAAFNDLRRHYNRPLDPGNALVAQANADYQAYLAEEIDTFNDLLEGDSPTLSQCYEALKALGRLTHSWQDFFSHAILLNGNAGPAWSAAPPVRADPDNLNPALKPASWGNILNTGEHGRTEPGTRDGGRAGYVARTADARDFVAAKYRTLLMAWGRKCVCFCPRNRAAGSRIY